MKAQALPSVPTTPPPGCPTPQPNPTPSKAADLRELLHDLGYGLDRTVEQITEDLQRVAAMLMLDIPAVRTLAAVALHSLGLPSGHAGPPPDADAVREAFEQARAGWAAAGVR